MPRILCASPEPSSGSPSDAPRRSSSEKPVPDWTWEDLDRAIGAPGPSSDPGYTVREYAARKGIPVRTAYDRIRKAVERGSLIKGTRLIGGRRVSVYRPAT